MKKLLFLPLFIFGFSTINAQDAKFEIGPEIGINYSNYASNESEFDNKFLTRFSFGVVGKLNFSENWSLKSKIKYDGKGTKSKNGSFEEKLNYVTIPVMAEWRFGNGNLKGFLNFGLYAGFLTSAKTKFSDNEEVDIKDVVKSVDLGGAYGIGVIYSIAENMNLIFELSGQTGATELDDSNVPTPYIRNQVFSSNIGLTFGL